MEINIFDEALRLSSMGHNLKLVQANPKDIESTKTSHELDRYQMILEAVKELERDTEILNENQTISFK